MISRRTFAALGSVGLLSTLGQDLFGRQLCPAPGYPPNTCSVLIDPKKFVAQGTAEHQKQSQWCWAACISMICNWHGYRMSQESIVTRVYKGLVNMPADDKVLTSALNSVWTSDDNRDFRITARVFSPQLGKNDVSNQRIIDDLRNDKPLLNGSGTHATVVARVDYVDEIQDQPAVQRVHVIDPFPGQAAPPLFARFLTREEMTPLPLGGSLRYLASIRIAPVKRIKS